jgi:hypothetical protein
MYCGRQFDGAHNAKVEKTKSIWHPTATLKGVDPSTGGLKEVRAEDYWAAMAAGAAATSDPEILAAGLSKAGRCMQLACREHAHSGGAHLAPARGPSVLYQILL